MQEPALGRRAPRRERSYICGYDGEGTDISVTFVSGPFPVPGGVFDTLVGRPDVVYVIVGNAPAPPGRRAREYSKTRRKTKNSENS